MRHHPPVITGEEHLQSNVEEGCAIIMNAAKECNSPQDITVWDETKPRWARIMDGKDPKLIWKSVNWKGTLNSINENQPTEGEFKEHFEKLFVNSTNNVDEAPNDLETAPYIPVLDDPFTYSEIEDAKKSMKKDKSYIGICPGILNILPVSWLMFLVTLINVIFTQCIYPTSWCYNKLFVLFKSGNRLLCTNYRGISIMDTFAKLYDVLILNRLLLWLDIDKCQAGAQKGRSCLEQIFSLRMLCDYAVCKKVKLFVLFIDYSKAYDRVPRHKLVAVLKSRGCGKIMLKAIQSMYTCTKNILKAAIIDATIGVRQGSPSSCLLFILYIDEMVRMIKSAIANDGFLGMLHALLLMDDTVILATNRDMCLKKFKVVTQYCRDYGMEINAKKTKFFVINGSDADKMPLQVDNTQICYSSQYLYLGAWFTDSGKLSHVISLHEKSNQAVVNKFSIFCASNSRMPFKYKKMVFEGAVMSSLLYSSESWLTTNIKPIEQQYNQLVRCLLGVRKNTSLNLCLLEAGIPPIRHIISRQRSNFLKSKVNVNDIDQPFVYVYNLCRNNNTTAYRFISEYMQPYANTNPFVDLVNDINAKKLQSTKFKTYAEELNVNMSLHPIYTTNAFIPDFLRESFSRLRLMSHKLRIETGRWSRTPRDARVCRCNNTSIQSEGHAVIECVLTSDIRSRYPMLDFTNINSLLEENTHLYSLCKYIHEVLKFYS